MDFKKVKIINDGKALLGIELGSTRIKAVLIDDSFNVLGCGSFMWENSLDKGYWTYSKDEIWLGVQAAYKELKDRIFNDYQVVITNLSGIGFSGMMHGYMVFDKDNEWLTPFRTWRNNKQGVAAKELTNLFEYPIPERWSIAHLYQAMLNNEEHVNDIDFMTTLAGYIHWNLTDEKVVGVGEASGMFPIDLKTGQFHKGMIGQFNELALNKGHVIDLSKILPSVRNAGDLAGVLTERGAGLIDPSGDLRPGIRMCPPEGDAGTGMVATNSVGKCTGNVSAGTSVFAMIVLEDRLQKLHDEIDLVTTPAGDLVAMVHSNNCSSDIDAWVKLLGEASEALGNPVSTDILYTKLFNMALEGDKDCGGLVSIGYLSGEHITHFEKGNPLFVRNEKAKFSLANFMRSHLYSALGALKIGLDILLVDEGVAVNELNGHGGYFKTKGVGQSFMASATGIPVSVMETAGEGGPWGMAVLAAYMNEADGVTLDEFLGSKVFKDLKSKTVRPNPEDVEGFNRYMDRYKKVLNIEKTAVDVL